MARVCRAVVAALWMLAASPAAIADIAFGVRTQLWPTMFTGAENGVAGDRIRHEVALGNLDRYGEIAAKWNIVDAWQEADQPADGFERLERVFAEHERRGIGIALRLLESPVIYDRMRHGSRSTASALRSYESWITAIAERFGARVRLVMISNEADHDVGWNQPVYRPSGPVAFEEYAAVLDVAYRAVKRARPGLVVADHGASSYSLCITVMSDLARAGRLDDALSFWRDMEYRAPDEAQRTVPGLLRMLASRESRRRVEFVRRSATELGSSRDVVQLHHYFGAAVLPEVLDWIRNRAKRDGASQPIIAAEVGYRIPEMVGKAWDGRPANVADMARYSEVDHGDAIARSFATLAGHGVRDILYWHMRAHHPRGSEAALYPPAEARNEFRPAYPARVAGFIFRELQLAQGAGKTPALAVTGLMEYRFARPAGDVSVIWSSAAAEIPAALRGAIVRVTDAEGVVLPEPEWLSTPAGGGPRVVFWRS